MIKNSNTEKTPGGKTIRLYIDTGNKIIAFWLKSDRDRFLKDNLESKIIRRTDAEKKYGAYAVAIARVEHWGR